MVEGVRDAGQTRHVRPDGGRRRIVEFFGRRAVDGGGGSGYCSVSCGGSGIVGMQQEF